MTCFKPRKSFLRCSSWLSCLPSSRSHRSFDLAIYRLVSTRSAKSQGHISDSVKRMSGTGNERSTEPLMESMEHSDNDIYVRSPLRRKWRLVGALLRIGIPLIFQKDGTLKRSALDFCLRRTKANSNPFNGIYTTDVVIDSDANVWARIFNHAERAESSQKLPVIVYYHGGGFTFGSADCVFYDKFCRTLAKAAQAVVVSVTYRLLPEFSYPVPYEDCFKVLQWLRSPEASSTLTSSADVSHCILAGDSAGGNLTHFTGLKAVEAEADLSPVKIRGLVMIQPFFGGEERTKSETTMKAPFFATLDLCDWFWRRLLPEGADRDHPRSNVFGPNAPDPSKSAVSRFPPTLIFVGSHDVLRDRGLAYAKKLQEVIGKETVTVNHIFGAFHGSYGLDPAIQKLHMDAIRSFVQGLLDGTGLSTRSRG